MSIAILREENKLIIFQQSSIKEKYDKYVIDRDKNDHEMLEYEVLF